MEYQKLVFILALLSAGGAAAHDDSMAHADAMHHHEVAQNSEDHHHHHHMAAAGYTSSVASYQTPDVKLVDVNGKEVSLRDSLDGPGPVMLNFIFTTCTTVCPVTSATFSQAQAKLGKVRLVSISIDPEHDTPARLKEYARRFEAGPQWSMLTGSIENSILAQRAFDTYRGDKMNHEPVTFMRKGPDQPWVRINGFIAADDLVREYDKLASN
jgi:protein SCO1/2